MAKLICRRCKTDNCVIQQAEDSHFKEIRCWACDWHMPIKYFNKKLINNQII